MSDSTQPHSRARHPRFQVDVSFYVGKKCIVIPRSIGTGVLIEAGGVLPEGGGGFDPRQARLHYKSGGTAESASVMIELPEDYPFRASRKGFDPATSVSFLPDGNPVPELRMLFALKTGSAAAMRAAMDELWHDVQGETIGQKLRAMNDVEGDHAYLKLLIGKRMTTDASRPNGLKNWLLWEKIADDAANLDRRRFEIASGAYPADNYGRFLKAVEESTLSGKGLPAQRQVEIAWQKLGGIGTFSEIRNTLGFGWLPAERYWKTHWLRRV